MKKYKVTFYETSYIVEAKNAEDAELEAMNQKDKHEEKNGYEGYVEQID
jgi:hypothetical protein